MKRIGLTGGIGSGKTTVAKIFESLGIAIYFADERAKKLMTIDADLVDAIKNTFGDNCYIDGELNRKHLASIVFNDSDKLEQLNKLVHPAVRKDFSAWTEGFSTDSTYILKEAAIIFETGGHKELDAVIVVSAPVEMRIERVISRDNTDEQSVRNRIDKQWSEDDRLKLADYVILNDGSLSLIEQVIDLHNDLSLAQGLKSLA